MTPNFLLPFIPISGFIAIAWVIRVIVDGIRRRQQARIAAEFHSKMLERMGSVRELGEFLNTPGGAKFLDSLTIERETGPHTRILRAVQTGIVTLSLGVGLFMIKGYPALPIEGRTVLNVLGTIATMLGVGLLVSAAASYALSRRMGLMNGESDRRDITATHSA